MSDPKNFDGITWKDLMDRMDSDIRISIPADTSETIVLFSEVSSATPVSIETIEIYDRTAMAENLNEVLTIAHRTEQKVDEIMHILKNNSRNDDEDTLGETQECLDVSDEEARALIEGFIREHGSAWPQDISLNLKLDFEQVMRITRKMIDEGVLEGFDNE